MKTALATIMGSEVMRVPEKGQDVLIHYLLGLGGEASPVHRAFGLT